MSNIVVDDTSPSLTYSGSWTLFAGGSSREWNSTVHSTFQYGATVSFQFRGSVCKVYATVPPSGNSSTVLMDVTIDGSVSPIVSQTSNSTAIYADLFYQSSAMESTWHTVIITNKGSAGNLDFEFDRVELDANDILPTISAFASMPSSTSSSPQTSPSNTSLPKTSQSTRVPPSTIGIVAGIIALLILLLLLFLYRRRQKAKNQSCSALMGVSSDNTTQNTTMVTPFTLGSLSPSPADLNAALNSPSRPPVFSAISEKALRPQPRANRSGNDLAVISTPTPTLSSPSNTPASLIPVPSTHDTGSISNVGDLTLQQPLLDLPPLSESLVSSLPAASQGPPEPNQANPNNDELRYLSGSTTIPSTSIYGGTVTTGMYDVPPAYQPNDSDSRIIESL